MMKHIPTLIVVASCIVLIVLSLQPVETADYQAMQNFARAFCQHDEQTIYDLLPPFIQADYSLDSLADEISAEYERQGLSLSRGCVPEVNPQNISLGIAPPATLFGLVDSFAPVTMKIQYEAREWLFAHWLIRIKDQWYVLPQFLTPPHLFDSGVIGDTRDLHTGRYLDAQEKPDTVTLVDALVLESDDQYQIGIRLLTQTNNVQRLNAQLLVKPTLRISPSAGMAGDFTARFPDSPLVSVLDLPTRADTTSDTQWWFILAKESARGILPEDMNLLILPGTGFFNGVPSLFSLKGIRHY